MRYAACLSQASAHVGAAGNADGKVLLLGALDLGGRVFLEQEHLRGEYEDGSGDWFLAEGEAASVFDAYARILAERYGTRQRPAPRVWCSWYSLYYFIHETLLLKVLKSLDDFPFDVFQIDDGWQQTVGDW
ncbi:MAG: alpha-galactosidase, partial [Anaerolineales bacterium]